MDPRPGDLAEHPPTEPDVVDVIIHPSRLLMAEGSWVLMEVDDEVPEL
jgi:hypothetical protein